MKERNFVGMFNKYAGENLIQKALTSASSVGEALIPEHLQKIITDTIIRLQPELGIIEPIDTEGAKVYQYNKITSKPEPGGAMGENSTTPVSNSTTDRETVTLKIVKRKGKVTNFLQDTSRKYINAAAWEMQSHLEAHARDLIYYILYGNAPANPYEFSGLDFFIASNRTNKARGGVVPADLSVLDDLIDASGRKGGMRHRRALLMSPELLSTISRMETSIRKYIQINGSSPFEMIDLPGGWRVQSYRGVPILETTSTSPIETMRPTITLSAVASGGSLSDGTYYVQIAPITFEGEQLASAEQTVTLAAGTAVQRFSIELDDIHKDANGYVNCYAYKIYVSTSTGTEVLKKIVPAFVYDGDGSKVAVTTNFNGDASNLIYISSLTPGTDVPSHMQSDVPLVATGGVSPEVLFLWDLDPIQGMGQVPYTNTGGSAFKGLVTTEELAKTDDFLPFLTKTYGCIVDSFEATSSMVRGLRAK